MKQMRIGSKMTDDKISQDFGNSINARYKVVLRKEDLTDVWGQSFIKTRIKVRALEGHTFVNSERGN